MRLLVLLLSLFTITSFACEEKGAQILATVDRVETDSLHFCRAFVSVDTIEIYNESQVCPLSKRQLIYSGIEFPLINGHDCEVYKGDFLSGVVYTRGKKIYLD